MVVPFGFDCKGALGALDEELSFGGGSEGEAFFMRLNGIRKMSFGAGEGLGNGVIGAIFDVGTQDEGNGLIGGKFFGVLGGGAALKA